MSRQFLKRLLLLTISITCIHCEESIGSYPVESGECNALREPWHLISQQKRDLYINGFRQLASDGKMAIFSQVHGNIAIHKHQNAVFLPWHRYFLWELEQQFRSLGDEYKCFAIPYWLS